MSDPADALFSRVARLLRLNGTPIGWPVERAIGVTRAKWSLRHYNPGPGVSVRGPLLLDIRGDLRIGARVKFEWLGDKAFVRAPLQARLAAERGVTLRTLPRRNQRRRVSAAGRRAFAALRRVVETVNGQLTGQFKLGANRALTLAGLTARLHSKLTAHTLCLCLNRRLGRPDILRIKELAFPPPN